MSACLVFPVQALRGWPWGGTYEFNRMLPGIHESVPHAALGLARSAYTIVKTVFGSEAGRPFGRRCSS